MKRPYVVLVLAAVVVLGALGLSGKLGTADWGRRGQAEAERSAFFGALSAAGIDVAQQGRDAWLSTGHRICADRRAGSSAVAAAQAFRDSDASVDGRQAAAVVSAAGYLCPDL